MNKLFRRLLTLAFALFFLIFGTLFHISSSEFWPMTISKTFWTPADFEASLLQKPLFSMLLALVHGLPLTDTQHIYGTKILFALLGLAGIFLLAHFVEKKTKNPFSYLVVLLGFLISPVLLQNFFRIRSDQLSFVFFVAALVLMQKGRIRAMLLSLSFVFLTSSKSMLFMIPGFFIFGLFISDQTRSTLRQTLTPTQKRLGFGTILAVAVWMLSVNIHGLYYFLETWTYSETYTYYMTRFLSEEGLLVAASAWACWHLYREGAENRPFIYGAIAAFFTLFLTPQILPFFIASYAGLIYLPLFLVLLKPPLNRKAPSFVVLILFVMQIFSVALGYLRAPERFFTGNDAQLTYIQTAAELIEKNHWSYLDGMGILPRQKLIPCFISPNDLEANESCKTKIQENVPDVIIITRRLSYLGLPLYSNVEDRSKQIRKNFWLRKDLAENLDPQIVDLQSGGLPLMIFGFE